MLCTLSTVEFDPLGYIEIEALPESSPGDAKRRVTRVTTLDGGAIFTDAGYAEADRTIELRWQPTGREQDESIERLVQLYQRIIISMPAGAFLVAPETFTTHPRESKLRLLVVERLSLSN